MRLKLPVFAQEKRDQHCRIVRFFPKKQVNFINFSLDGWWIVIANSKIVILIICLSIGLIAFIPSTAFPLAGIGEVDSTFHFNQYANLNWVHPGDICDGDDSYCLRLEKVQHGIFEGLEYSLEEINIPKNKSIPIILARRSMDNTWLVYDLANEAYLIEATAFKDAYAEWKSRGFNALSFIDTKNPDKFLSETNESIKRKWRLKAFFYFTPCLILSIVFGSLAISFHNKYSKSDLKENLALSIVFIVLFGITIIFVSIFIWAMH
jgi:hypothetical protein